jgi:hypothetical protein
MFSLMTIKVRIYLSVGSAIFREIHPPDPWIVGEC